MIMFRVFGFVIIAFMAPASYACIGVLQKFQVRGTSFADEVFAMVFTDYGYSLETGGDRIFYHHQKNKWCVLPAKATSPDCDLDLSVVNVTDSKDPQKTIGQIIPDPGNSKCMLVQSISKSAKTVQVDKAAPYFKLCDRSNVLGSTDENILASELVVEVWEKGKQKGEMSARSPLSSYDAATGTMKKVKYRGLGGEASDSGKYDIYGKSVTGSGCHMDVSDYKDKAINGQGQDTIGVDAGAVQ